MIRSPINLLRRAQIHAVPEITSQPRPCPSRGEILGEHRAKSADTTLAANQNGLMLPFDATEFCCGHFEGKEMISIIHAEGPRGVYR